jgi:hypothetical protein
MPSFQQEVRSRDDPAVGRGEHRGVVTNPDDRPGAGPHPRRHLGDEAELAQVPDAGPLRVRTLPVQSRMATVRAPTVRAPTVRAATVRASGIRVRRAWMAGAVIAGAGGVFAAPPSLITHKSGPSVNSDDLALWGPCALR